MGFIEKLKEKIVNISNYNKDEVVNEKELIGPKEEPDKVNQSQKTEKENGKPSFRKRENIRQTEREPESFSRQRKNERRTGPRKKNHSTEKNK